MGSQFPDQGSNPRPLLWKHGGLTTGPPGKSLPLCFVGSVWVGEKEVERKKKGIGMECTAEMEVGNVSSPPLPRDCPRQLVPPFPHLGLTTFQASAVQVPAPLIALVCEPH